MRVILEGRGRMAIDIHPSSDDAHQRTRGNRARHEIRSRRRWRRAPRSGGSSLFDVGAFHSGEDALFAGLMFLLQRYRERTGRMPTHEILTAVMRTLEDLLLSGKLPPPGDRDRTFLAMLQVILEQVATVHQVRWLDELIQQVRATIVGFDKPDDDDSDDGSGAQGDGSGGPGGEGSSEGGDPDGSRNGRSGNNGVPTRGGRKSKK